MTTETRARRPRVFTIAPGAPFLPTLAQALLAGELVPGFPDSGSPDALARATIYLPTQRAARALAAHLSALQGGRPALLPRIVPLGEADDAELEIAAGLLEHEDAEGVLAPPIAPLERRLILAGMIQKFASVMGARQAEAGATHGFAIPSAPADAIALAADLEALMDDFTYEDIPASRLDDLVDGEFSHYFEFTLAFLRIATQAWPDILAERGASDPAARRSRLIDAQARLFARQKPAGPVIAAGSTGSIPSTARLIAAIARLEEGAVVLPGLDLALDDESWSAIGRRSGDGPESPLDPAFGHPQAVLSRLLSDALKIGRDEVVPLGASDAGASARARLFSEAMRPAETTDRWAALAPDEREGLARDGGAGLAIVEAGDEREEALVAALALREALEAPGRTAALITPDRALAARVCAELGRWGVRVSDSAGSALSHAPAGKLARLAADAALSRFAPVALLALLAHPDLRLGLPREQTARAVSALEIGLLRGPRPGEGFSAMRAALAMRREQTAARPHHSPPPRRRMSDEDWAGADDLLARLADAFAGFSPEASDPAGSLVALAANHRACVEALVAQAPDEPSPVDDDPSWDELFALFDECAMQGEGALLGRFADYPAFFAALASQRVVRPDGADAHRRLKILGPLEARLLDIDRIVLGGLDEGVWPPATQTDAFLNRPMRAALGLPPPERRIGQSAHDFVQGACARDVVVTRARKRGSAPTVPSRFLQRLKAFVGEKPWEEMVGRGERLRFLARHVDADPPAPPLARPDPRPDPALFPRRLSVTAIETLVRDPYSIFASHVLRLGALEAVGEAPGAALRGEIVHDVFARFVKAFPKELPADDAARRRIESLLDDALAPYAESFPDIHADWTPRLRRIVADFVEWEGARRPEIETILVERPGEIAIPVGGDIFTLSARADRIERMRDGRVVAIDFKTGQVPSNKEIGVGFAPQLTLEAAMLMRDGFPDIGQVEETPELLYLRASGGTPPIAIRAVKPPDRERSMEEIVAEHYAGLETLLARFFAGEIGYMSRPYAQYARRFNEYDHLARVKEWSAAGGADVGGEGE
ncbi:MAG: double-strand break repair protein AddB [Salinarimonadaceae bacterium]|nr:MAG: double-strand break repair protein AddB [Salinarimonadaceae bacterium]